MLEFEEPLLYLVMTPKHKNIDTDDLDIAKRSHKVFSLSERVKILDLVRKLKSYTLNLVRSTVRKKSFCEVMKKERKFVLVSPHSVCKREIASVISAQLREKLLDLWLLFHPLF